MDLDELEAGAGGCRRDGKSARGDTYAGRYDAKAARAAWEDLGDCGGRPRHRPRPPAAES